MRQIATHLAIVALGCAIAGSQESQGPTPLNPVTMKTVCPLSEQQTQDAIDAFAKLVPVFHHKRCANCHGGVDPFAKDHPEGPHTREEMVQGACNLCHSNLPRSANGNAKMWTLPFPGHEFGDKDALHLCKMMKTSFSEPNSFLDHLQDDDGRTNFQGVSFAGTRGLNEYGQGYAFTKPYRPEPIEIMGLPRFLELADDWVKAMGRKFQGDIRCGCEPVNFDVRVTYEATIDYGPLHSVSTMGPVNIPIKFDKNGAFEGTGELPYSEKDFDTCYGHSQGSMQIKVSGKATEEKGQNEMDVQLTNTTPGAGSVGVTCTPKSFLNALRGANKLEFPFHLAGKDGEWKELPVPLAPMVKAKVRVDLVDHDQAKSPASQ